MIKKIGYTFLVSLFMLLLIATLLVVCFNKYGNPLHQYIGPFTHAKKVLSYKPMIEKELDKYNLGEFTPVLLAIMYQESKGEGNDPMQSSESAGLKRNEIQDPKMSIQQGVYHFYKMYTLGIKKGVDMNTIIQSYNMGPGYINYVAENGLKHSEELAKKYSKMQVDKHPDLYTCGGFKGNFRYPYCFGDFTYVAKVQEKVSILEKKL
jgi:hypothetical protein